MFVLVTRAPTFAAWAECPLAQRRRRAVAARVSARLEVLQPVGSPWMTSEEAIEYSRLPAGTFRKKAAAGEIPCHGGRTKVFHRAEVDAALGYASPSGRQPRPLRRADAA